MVNIYCKPIILYDTDNNMFQFLDGTRERSK